MNKSSAVYAVLSPENIPPLNMGEKLSPMNNSNHPQLTKQTAMLLAEAVELVRHDLTQLLPVVEILKKCDIEHKSFLMALNTLHSYIYICDVTLQLQKNEAIANWAYSHAAGAK